MPLHLLLIWWSAVAGVCKGIEAQQGYKVGVALAVVFSHPTLCAPPYTALGTCRVAKQHCLRATQAVCIRHIAELALQQQPHTVTVLSCCNMYTSPGDTSKSSNNTPCSLCSCCQDSAAVWRAACCRGIWPATGVCRFCPHLEAHALISQGVCWGAAAICGDTLHLSAVAVPSPGL